MESTKPRGDDDDISFITSNKPHFFKIIVEDTIREGKLAIPKEFVKKYGSKLPNSVFLRVPSGRVWAMELSKHDDNIWLQNGWQEFADYYSLEYGHLLVFEFQGYSRFLVILFDKSATEINYQSCHIMHKEEPTPNAELKEAEIECTEDNDSVEILDGFMTNHRTRRGSPFPFLGSQKKMRKDSTSPMEGNSMLNGSSSGPNISQKAGVSKRECSFTSDENVEDFQRASSFKSENPYFKLVMQPSYVCNGSTITVPRAFTNKYPQRKSLEMKLIVADKSWPVILAKYESNSCKITRGWSAFAKENALRVGDLCIFQLLNTDVLKVSIFRLRHTG